MNLVRAYAFNLTPHSNYYETRRNHLQPQPTIANDDINSLIFGAISNQCGATVTVTGRMMTSQSIKS